MKVILLTDVPEIGKKKQVLEVKSGYANNFLFKKGLAVPANEENMKKLNDEIAAKKAEEAKIKQEAIDVKNIINGKSVKIALSGGPDGKLYGSVTSMDISAAIEAELHVSVEKRKIVSEPIKSAGTYTIKCRLYSGVEAEIYLVVSVK